MGQAVPGGECGGPRGCGECGCNPRERRRKDDYFRAAEPDATRSCLPQVDPLHAERRAAVEAAAAQYSLRRSDRSGDGEWPVLLPDPLPACEQPAEYFVDLTDCRRQIVEALRAQLGDGVAAQFDAAERWEAARAGRLPGAGVGVYGGGGGDEPDEEKWASWAEADELFVAEGRERGFPRPRLLERWLDDVAWCALRLTGPNAAALARVPSAADLPADLELTVAELDERLLGRLEGWGTVGAAAEAGRIFVVDYTDALRCAVRYDADDGAAPLCNPIALFYQQSNKQLSPLLIQLYGRPDPARVPINRVYTPDDNRWAWAMAKMFFNQADMHHHLICNLYTQTVMAGGVAHAATCRSLSPHHPLRQLLRPHILGCLAAAERVHNTLFAAAPGELGGLLRWTAAPQDTVRALAASAWRRLSLGSACLASDCERRLGAQAGSELRGKYRYRDDGELLWKALEDYVRLILQKYYARPEDVEEDAELHAWLREVSEQLGGYDESTHHDPQHPSERLVTPVASVIFLCSAQYRARTEALYDTYACPFAFPGRPLQPPCLDKEPDDVTQDDLLRMLPDKRACMLQVATCYVLSGRGAPPPLAHWRLGDFGRDLFVDRAANQIPSEALPKTLAEVARQIGGRNASLEAPYEAFHPECVRNSFGTH